MSDCNCQTGCDRCGVGETTACSEQTEVTIPENRGFIDYVRNTGVYFNQIAQDVVAIGWKSRFIPEAGAAEELSTDDKIVVDQACGDRRWSIKKIAELVAKCMPEKQNDLDALKSAGVTDYKCGDEILAFDKAVCKRIKFVLPHVNPSTEFPLNVDFGVAESGLAVEDIINPGEDRAENISFEFDLTEMPGYCPGGHTHARVMAQLVARIDNVSQDAINAKINIATGLYSASLNKDGYLEPNPGDGTNDDGGTYLVPIIDDTATISYRMQASVDTGQLIQWRLEVKARIEELICAT